MYFIFNLSIFNLRGPIKWVYIISTGNIFTPGINSQSNWNTLILITPINVMTVARLVWLNTFTESIRKNRTVCARYQFIIASSSLHVLSVLMFTHAFVSDRDILKHVIMYPRFNFSNLFVLANLKKVHFQIT